jgi:hypothetical protein
MGNGMICGSGIATVVAVSLQTVGLLALLIGFFSGVGDPDSREGWSAGVFLAGVVAIAFGSRIYMLC